MDYSTYDNEINFLEVEHKYMRTRACIKCREYITIHPNNPINQNTLKSFDKKHKGHTVITVELNEIKDQYQKF
ncbi:MAG: hypothetical protein GF317_08930 [Candidatus Lokiarchaeota archaeon]|jgi:hypothetical protein|nr:hypothetical protein [Candidatus Lokiarchaeota archaeon]MBD3199835.1 hypothetical protein [Candidatus Lokiarchaeota archaeon]